MSRQHPTRRLVQSVAVADGLLAATVISCSAAHAGYSTVPPSLNTHVSCRVICNDQQLAFLPDNVVTIHGTCFNGTTNYVAVYDLTQGRHLTTKSWTTVTTDANGAFTLIVPGANYDDQVEALAYDSGWGSHANQGTWQTYTLYFQPN